jgi:oligoribonuclease (3'-5' exoribonuclease)
MILAGLDIETTGVDINAGHRLIQIGIAFQDGLHFVADVLPSGDMAISAEALNINRFTLERIGKASPAKHVDETIANQLREKGYKENSVTPVGWNVGGFDMCFIKRELPKIASFFTYRTLDLTGVAIMHELRTGKSYRDLKDAFHAKIVEKLGRNERHDALYDAEAALIAIDLFKELA